MLTEVCEFVHNYFECLFCKGEFEIVDGALNLDAFIKNGQRFRICGSTLNDGIYTYHSGGEIYDDDGAKTISLNDETFTGTIVGMAVPTAFLRIVQDIKAWQDKNHAVVDSPYQSESFGGYSYTKATGSGGGNALSWRDIYRTRLNEYRKIA